MTSMLDEIRRVLEARREVRLAYLFGSAARGEARSRSDVDIAVLFEPEPDPDARDRLVVELEDAADRVVDLVALHRAPPLLAHEVMSGGRLLVCRDEGERVRFEAWVAARYLDTGHLRRVQYAYLRERVDTRRARPA